MCIAALHDGGVLFAYIISRIVWMASSPLVPRIDAPRICFESASTRVFLHESLSLAFFHRSAAHLGHGPSPDQRPLARSFALPFPVILALPSGGSM